jgi:hypothetical protein
MGLTIEFGWWLAPLAVTAGSFAWASWKCKGIARGTGGGYLPDMTGLVELFYWVPAIVVSLVAWLIWALAT